MVMEILHLSPNSLGLCSSHNYSALLLHNIRYHTTRLTNVRTIFRASAAAAAKEGGGGDDESPCVDFAFISSRLLPDGSPDVAMRSATGGRKLRNIMKDSHIDLYGPYDKALLNFAGGGTCGTCLVEVVAGKELLSPRTEKEKEKLKNKPRSWRLACQTVVGKEDSKGELVIQTLPEWKVHEWELLKQA